MNTNTKAALAAGGSVTAIAAGTAAYLIMAAAVTVTDFSRTPSSLDVTGAPASVTCTMTLSTTGDAIMDAVCAMVSPRGEQRRSCIARTGTAGAWSCAIEIPSDVEEGTGATPWKIEYITARTVIDPINFIKWTNADLVALGLPSVPDSTALDIDITSTNQDIAPPVITSFSALPTSVTPGSPVTCTIVADDQSGTGIQDRGCTFSSTESYDLSCLGQAESCNLDIPGNATTGVIWNEVNHFARDMLGNMTVNNSGAAFTVAATGGACDGFSATYSGVNGWSPTQAEAVAVSTLTVDFYGRATVANQGAGFGVSSSAIISNWAQLPMTIRFSTTGEIDVVHDGTIYSCDGACPTYVVGDWYHFIITANLTAQTYTVQMENCDNGLVTLATDFVFRTGADPTNLAYHAAWSSLVNPFDVANMVWTAGGCVPDDCTTLGAVCGIQPDGCGGSTQDCGTCINPDVCVSGACCTPDTTCNGGAYVCGTPPDGCGGVQSCGTCTGQEVCDQSYICGPASSRPWAYNTGPTDVGALVPSGTLTLNVSDTVYENLDISGRVSITANNVTLRNFRIDSNNVERYGIQVSDGLSGIVIEDGELFGNVSAAIRGLGYTARRLHMYNGFGDALKPAGGPGSGPTLIENCFVEKQGLSAGAHADASQVSGVDPGSYNVEVRNNNMFMPNPGTPGHPGDASKSSSIFMFGQAPVNWNIHDNWADGGSFTIYCKGGVSFRDNIIGINNDGWPNYTTRLVSGTCTNWCRNTWENDGTPAGSDYGSCP